MLTVLNCIAAQHDLRLVALAAVICIVASLTTMTLLRHIRNLPRSSVRKVWLAGPAIAAGFGIWATHFIAMLAFSPGLPNGYSIPLTLLSLLIAVAVTALGIAVAVSAVVHGGVSLGGLIIGCGVAAMHYTGMAAFETEGRIIWDYSLIATSVLLSGVFAMAALHVCLGVSGARGRFIATLLFAAAICAHHFTAMAAVTIVPDPTIIVPPNALPGNWLAIGVALASVVIILLEFGGWSLDIREQRRAKLEAERMRGLANAAVEGLLVCDGEAVTAANDSFAELSGFSPSEIVGAELTRFFPHSIAPVRRTADCHTIEAELRHRDGPMSPVELVRRPIDFAGKPHDVIAVRDLRERRQAEQHIQFLALHDALTGVPNRACFNEALDQAIDAAINGGYQLAVLCLDLDRFKEVNDLFGHSTGDAALQTVARCVTGLLNQDQMMARLGGDEFAVILPKISARTSARRVAENIREALLAESSTAEPGCFVSASIGIAICPFDGVTREELLNHADAALYEAKADRGSYQFFEETMGAVQRDRRLLQNDLRRALARGELRLVYQPQTSIETGEVIGFEALLRWTHPTRGAVPPDQFIPLAEEAGSIIEIGEWVLREACREAATWRSHLIVAVNLSRTQLHDVDFARSVHEILLQTGLPPGRLELEVTETALIRDLDRALATLRQIKALGVRVAMDDFGTGYSSLSNLRAFPFDRLKIDTSFVKSIDVQEKTAAIVRAVLGLGHGLGIPVVAEGVENERELQFLARERCDAAQGYYFARPADIAQFEKITRGSKTDCGDQQLAQEKLFAVAAS